MKGFRMLTLRAIVLWATRSNTTKRTNVETWIRARVHLEGALASSFRLPSLLPEIYFVRAVLAGRW